MQLYKRKTKFKGFFPTEESAFKVMYLAAQEQQAKWNMSSIRDWFEIYPQLSMFFSEIVSKYTKRLIVKRSVYAVYFTLANSLIGLKILCAFISVIKLIL